MYPNWNHLRWPRSHLTLSKFAMKHWEKWMIPHLLIYSQVIKKRLDCNRPIENAQRESKIIWILRSFVVAKGIFKRISWFFSAIALYQRMLVYGKLKYHIKSTRVTKTNKVDLTFSLQIHILCFIRNAYKEQFSWLFKFLKNLRNKLVIFQRIKERSAIRISIPDLIYIKSIFKYSF